jgi:hypothetical protein
MGLLFTVGISPPCKNAMEEYDEEFSSLLKTGWTLENCRMKSIDVLEALLDSLGGPVEMS